MRTFRTHGRAAHTCWRLEYVKGEMWSHLRPRGLFLHQLNRPSRAFNPHPKVMCVAESLFRQFPARALSPNRTLRESRALQTHILRTVRASRAANPHVACDPAAPILCHLSFMCLPRRRSAYALYCGSASRKAWSGSSQGANPCMRCHPSFL